MNKFVRVMFSHTSGAKRNFEYKVNEVNDDKYIVIDTDKIIKDRLTDNRNCIEFREFLKKKYNEEELIRYQNRKLGMFEWYKSLNIFLENIEKM